MHLKRGDNKVRIERIDDSTVKCFLSKEELDEYEVSYTDFITRSEKVREMVDEILAQAGEEVGFQPTQPVLEVQIMILPDQGIVLTFSEKSIGESKFGRDLKGWLDMIKNMLSQKGGMSGAEETSGDQKGAGLEQGAGQEQSAGLEQDMGQEQGEAPVPMAAFVFERLEDVWEYAAVVPEELKLESSLYKAGRKYYLYLERGETSDESFNRACIRAMEFDGLYMAGESRMGHIREQAECMIEEQALTKLRM